MTTMRLIHGGAGEQDDEPERDIQNLISREYRVIHSALPSCNSALDVEKVLSNSLESIRVNSAKQAVDLYIDLIIENPGMHLEQCREEVMKKLNIE